MAEITCGVNVVGCGLPANGGWVHCCQDLVHETQCERVDRRVENLTQEELAGWVLRLMSDLLHQFTPRAKALLQAEHQHQKDQRQQEFEDGGEPETKPKHTTLPH